MTTLLSGLLEDIKGGDNLEFPTFRTWLGPLTGHGTPIAEIVSKIGLHAEGREVEFTPVTAQDAPIWFAQYAVSSLIHGASPVPPGYLERVHRAIAHFGADATFMSKGEWLYTRRGYAYEQVRAGNGWDGRRHRVSFQSGSLPLEPALLMIDGGIVGYTAKTGFVLWVIEED